MFQRTQTLVGAWPLPAELPDSALEARLYRAHGEVASDTREPDWQHVHAELARKHVTLAALWGEYRKAHTDGYQYSWFCAAYRAWAAKIDVVMRFPHKAGEKLFVGWAGDTVPISSLGPIFSFHNGVRISDAGRPRDSWIPDIHLIACGRTSHLREE